MDTSGPLDILYVDPSPDAPAFATRLGASAGLSVAHVRDAASARTALDSGAYDAVVSDYHLPDGDALALLRSVRADAPAFPFVVCPDDGSEALASAAIGGGVTDYVPKPTDSAGMDRLVDRIRAAVDRAAERRRVAERERIGRVVRDINHALVRASTREELESRVCEILSEADPYVFAWIGEPDPDTAGIDVRAWAGVERDYLDEITITTDDSPTGRGPTGRALRTRDFAVVQDVQADPSFEPWRVDATERGYQSVAAIPLEYGETLYGLLGVYSDRPAAFDADERSLLEEVAADIGYAIDAMAMRKEAERYSELAEHAPVGIFRTEAVEGGRFVEANPATAAIVGANSPADLVGRETAPFYADSDVRRDLLSRVRTGDVVTEEVRLRTLDGDVVWVLLTLLPRRGGDGNLYFDGAATDVSERKRLERELVEEREFVERIFETSPVGITVLDADGDVVRANDRAERILGLSTTEITDRTYDAPAWHIYDETNEPIPSADLPFARVRATGDPVYGYEHGVEHPDGTKVWLSVSMAPMTDADGEFVRAVGAFEDVTDRKAYQRRVREQKERLETIVSNAPVILFALDADGVFTLSEGRGLGALGFETGEVVGESIYDVFGDHAAVVDAADRALDGESVYTELEFGDVVFDTWFQPISADHGLERVIGVAVDVTERATYEREQELFRLLIDQSNDSLFVADPESGAFTYVNDTMAERLDYDEADLLERTVVDVETTLSDADAWADHVEEVRREGSGQFVGEHRRAGGGTVPVEVSVGYVSVGTDAYYVAIARDVSELRERVQQLRVLGRVLRHNLRNAMNVVLGNAELIREEGGSAVQTYAETILATADRLLETSEKAYQLDEEFLRETRPTAAIDVERVLESERKYREMRYPDATIAVEAEADLRAQILPSIRLAVGELLENAVRHSDRERPRVEATAWRTDGTVVVEVADDGPGIPESEVAVLSDEQEFDQLHHASGLGLWLVYWLVTRSGGSLAFRPNEPRGSVVVLELPAGDQ